ncbi:MAG TPA: hypothetical protein VF956_02460 [Candidatus Dormibacteraeota bacterium]
MNGWSVVRWTGLLGLAGTAFQLVAFAFLFATGLPPTFDDTARVLAYVKDAHFALTTATLLFFIGFALVIGFNAGLRALAVAAAADHEWLATTTFAAGLATLVLGFAGVGLLLADAAIVAGNHADAAQVRTLFETSGVLGGAPLLVPVAFYLGAAASLGATTRILPRWLAIVGWVGSVLVLIASLSAYGGSDPAAFWSAGGMVTILALLPLYVWTLGASVAFVRRPPVG